MTTGSKPHVCNIQFWFLCVNYLSIWNDTFWSKPCNNQTSGCTNMGNSLNFQNNAKHKNLPPVLARYTESILSTSDSFFLTMSKISPFPLKGHTLQIVELWLFLIQANILRLRTRWLLKNQYQISLISCLGIVVSHQVAALYWACN